MYDMLNMYPYRVLLFIRPQKGKLVFKQAYLRIIVHTSVCTIFHERTTYRTLWHDYVDTLILKRLVWAEEDNM